MFVLDSKMPRQATCCCGCTRSDCNAICWLITLIGLGMLIAGCICAAMSLDIAIYTPLVVVGGVTTLGGICLCFCVRPELSGNMRGGSDCCFNPVQWDRDDDCQCAPCPCACDPETGEYITKDNPNSRVDADPRQGPLSGITVKTVDQPPNFRI